MRLGSELGQRLGRPQAGWFPALTHSLTWPGKQCLGINALFLEADGEKVTRSDYSCPIKPWERDEAGGGARLGNVLRGFPGRQEAVRA